MVRAGAAFLIALVLGFAAEAQSFGPLKGAVFGSGSNALVIVLHGDVSKGGAADYHYAFARDVAAAHPGVVAAALLRPGYYDGEGRTSPGSNNDRRDHYTAQNNDMVAETIRSLKAAYGAGKVIAVGHSGGAAQLGAVLGRHPGLVDAAVLVSCPCDIGAWRESKNAKPWPKSESPQDFVGAVGPIRIVAVTGADDDNTRASLASRYVSAAKAAGASAEMIKVDGAGHGFGRLSQTVANVVNAELAR